MWYPTLLNTANMINSHSWFNIKKITNRKKHKHKKYKTSHSVTYIDTLKLKLYLSNKQSAIIKKWLNDCIDVYNITNQFIKTYITNDNHFSELNFINIRKKMNDQIRVICKINHLNKHTADYSVKLCVEMYKSSFSNKKDMDKFNIRDLAKDGRRKNLVIEPASVSRKINSIFVKQLGNIKSSIPLSIITKNSILQYDSYKNTFIIISPKEIENTYCLDQYKKCGVDIGVRTFLTTYSDNGCYEIGSNTYPVIDKINKKKDLIKSDYDNKLITTKSYKRLVNKYCDKLSNKISDLHNKSANFLLNKYSEIIIGKVSIKSMISNNSNLNDITKRRLVALSHYRFRMKLKQMAPKFNCNIVEVSEYLTSKTCFNCGNIKQDLGSNKVYKCDNCDLEIDRDINASINIYVNKVLKYD